MNRLICLVSVLLGLTTIQARQRQNFDADWLFILADSVQMSEVTYNDAFWRHLDLPHDWAREGDFYAGNPSGATGGALPGGVGWYRKHFAINREPITNNRYYNLHGQRMSKPRKGLNIIDGKKVIIQ